MLSLNMVLFLYLGKPLTPIPGLTAGQIKISKKIPLNKNVILYSLISFQSQFYAESKYGIILCFVSPLTLIPGFTAG
jgi:hypothetical protein